MPHNWPLVSGAGLCGLKVLVLTLYQNVPPVLKMYDKYNLILVKGKHDFKCNYKAITKLTKG